MIFRAISKIKSFGHSMFPLLHDGDIVYLKRIRFSAIKVNDIITIRKLGKIFTHRVIYRIGKSLITKGDNNLSSDGKIYPKQIIGKLYQVKRGSNIFNPEDIYLIQSSLYFAEIVKIKKALEKEKIDFVFLKGLPLHLYFEGKHPRRIYADCDILIAPKDYPKAKKILEKRGYRYHDDSYSKTHRILKDKYTEFSFYKTINNFPVLFDVHLEPVFMMNQLGKLEMLYMQKFIDSLTENFLREKQQLAINNYQFPILSSSNLILYLSLHFFHHNFRGAYRLELLDRVIRKALQISPPPRVSLALSEKILDYQLQNFVYPVFLLLKKYYDTPITKSFLAEIKPNGDKLNYISKSILRINIFDEQSRVDEGLLRFKNLFFLSPSPLWKKMLIIFNIQVVYSAFWLMIFFLRRSFKRFFKSS